MFTPRTPVHQGDYVDAPRSRSEFTRWQQSETSFGPVGKIVVTTVLGLVLLGMLAVALSSPIFVFLMVTGVIPGGTLAVWALRDTWKPVRTNHMSYRSPGIRWADIAQSIKPPSFREMSRGRRLAVGAGTVGYIALVLVYFRLPDDWQVGFITFLGLFGVGLLAATVLRRD